MVCATATGRKTTALNGSQRFQVLRHTARILKHTFVIAIDLQGDGREKTAAAVAATEGHKSGFSYVSVYAFDVRTEHSIAVLSQTPRISLEIYPAFEAEV